MSTQQMYVNQVPVADVQIQNPIGYSVPGTYYGDVNPNVVQVQQPQMQVIPQQRGQMMETQYEVKPQHKGKWKTGLLIAAFVIAVLAAIGLIILAFVYGFGSHINNKRPGWTIVNISVKNSILYAAGNNIFTIANSAGSSATVAVPTSPVNLYRSRMFIINNTANSNNLKITPASGVVMVDTTPTPGIIASKTSATYYWAADSDTFVRLD